MVRNLYNVILSNMIQKDPGVIVGPITQILGYIFDIIFYFVYSLSEIQALGISIILLTILVRVIMLPLAIKSQKSMLAMQAMTPEVEKIKAKYGDVKGNREKEAEMNQEIQKLYMENNVNPLAGCLPLFIQMPIFIALNYLMNNTYKYVGVIGDIYSSITTKIMETVGYEQVLSEITEPMLTKKLAETFDITQASDVIKVVNKMSVEGWNTLYESFPNLQASLLPLIEQKDSIENFLGINLTEAAGRTWPGILIPILAAFTTFLTSYISMKQSPSSSSNQQMQTQQQMMMIVMPIMIGFMTVSLTAGVGVYWITSSVFQIFQQLILGKKFKAAREEAAKLREEKEAAKKQEIKEMLKKNGK